MFEFKKYEMAGEIWTATACFSFGTNFLEIGPQMRLSQTLEKVAATLPRILISVLSNRAVFGGGTK